MQFHGEAVVFVELPRRLDQSHGGRSKDAPIALLVGIGQRTLLQTNKLVSGEKLLKKIAQELKHPTPRAAIEGGLEILRELRSAGAILGTWHQ